MLLMLLMLHVDRRRRPHTRLVCEDDRMRLTYGSSDTRQKMRIGRARLKIDDFSMLFYGSFCAYRGLFFEKSFIL